MTNDPTRTRRRYSRELKAQIIAECDVMGVSVAKVAMSHSINANIVHGWRKEARQRDAVAPVRPPEFVTVSLAPAAATAADCNVEIELRGGAVFMKITWPACAAVDLVAWTRGRLQ